MAGLNNLQRAGPLLHHPSPVHPRRPGVVRACAAPAVQQEGSASSSGLSISGISSTRGSSLGAAGLAVRSAASSDAWAAADIHCNAFYPNAGPFWGPLLRLDRVLSLQVGRDREDLQRVGNFACLLATTPDGRSPGEEAPPADLGPFVRLLAGWLLKPGMRENMGERRSSVLGVVVVDSLSDHLPPRRQERHGVVRMARRKGVAYVSNLAVAAEARRRGVGLALVRRAEAAAVGWGCRTMALHVDPSNTAAVELYRRAGYRVVPAGAQPEWQRLLEGRPVALALMMRALPRPCPPAPAAG